MTWKMPVLRSRTEFGFIFYYLPILGTDRSHRLIFPEGLFVLECHIDIGNHLWCRTVNHEVYRSTHEEIGEFYQYPRKLKDADEDPERSRISNKEQAITSDLTLSLTFVSDDVQKICVDRCAVILIMDDGSILRRDARISQRDYFRDDGIFRPMRGPKDELIADIHNYQSHGQYHDLVIFLSHAGVLYFKGASYIKEMRTFLGIGSNQNYRKNAIIRILDEVKQILVIDHHVVVLINDGTVRSLSLAYPQRGFVVLPLRDIQQICSAMVDPIETQTKPRFINDEYQLLDHEGKIIYNNVNDEISTYMASYIIDLENILWKSSKRTNRMAYRQTSLITDSLEFANKPPKFGTMTKSSRKT